MPLAPKRARIGELATLGLLVERGILFVDMAESWAGAGG